MKHVLFIALISMSALAEDYSKCPAPYGLGFSQKGEVTFGEGYEIKNKSTDERTGTVTIEVQPTYNPYGIKQRAYKVVLNKDKKGRVTKITSDGEVPSKEVIQSYQQIQGQGGLAIGGISGGYPGCLVGGGSTDTNEKSKQPAKPRFQIPAGSVHEYSYDNGKCSLDSMVNLTYDSSSRKIENSSFYNKKACDEIQKKWKKHAPKIESCREYETKDVAKAFQELVNSGVVGKVGFNNGSPYGLVGGYAGGMVGGYTGGNGVGYMGFGGGGVFMGGFGYSPDSGYGMGSAAYTFEMLAFMCSTYAGAANYQFSPQQMNPAANQAFGY